MLVGHQQGHHCDRRVDCELPPETSRLGQSLDRARSLHRNKRLPPDSFRVGSLDRPTLTNLAPLPHKSESPSPPLSWHRSDRRLRDWHSSNTPPANPHPPNWLPISSPRLNWYWIEMPPPSWHCSNRLRLSRLGRDWLGRD